MRGFGIRFVLVLGLLASASGCYRHTFIVPGTTPGYLSAASGWRHHLIAGLIDLSGEIDLNSACPGGVSIVDERTNFWNWLVTVFTASIYSPTRVKIWCNTNGTTIVPVSVELRPNDEMVARWREAYPGLEQDLREHGEPTPATVLASEPSAPSF
ncbi:MAG: hypothetical protein U0230_22555 [Polyangiales bacterium]